MTAHVFAAADEIAEGAVRSRLLAGRPVAVARLRGRLFAFGALCPHQQQDLATGILEDDGRSLSCSRHLWRFDLGTGACAMGPGLPVYTVREDAGHIVVEL